MEENISKNILFKTKKQITIEFFVCVVLRAILLIIPILYSSFVNNLSSKKFDGAVIAIIIYIGIIFVYKLFEYLRQYSFYKVYNKLYTKYTEVASVNTYSNSLFSLSRFSIGEYMNIMNTDVDVISGFFSNGIYRVVQLLEFLVIYYYFFKISIVLFAVTLVFSVIVIIAIIISGNKLQTLNEKRKSSYDKKVSVINNIFTGIKDIKGFNILNSIKTKIIESTERYVDSNAKYARIYNLIIIGAVLFFEIIRLIVLLIAIKFVVNGKLELGVILIIYSYYQKIIDNFSLISTLNLEYKNFKISLNRFNKISEHANIDKNNGVILKNIDGNIEFKDVLYGYKEEPVLNKISFKISHNTVNVLTGSVGSGKNGIFDLLLKLNRQHEGTIKLDEYDIQKINNKSYYQNVALASKDAVFIDGSIRETLNLIETDNEKIESVCKLIGVHDDIMNLPSKYETNINSDKVSSTIKRLITIARVFLKEPKVMLFDEIIETLDKSNKKNILKVINESKQDHTIIIISRDNEILKCSDNIILLNHSKIVDTGTYSELMKKKTNKELM